MRHGMRAATAEEATADYLKRQDALEEAIERGIYSTAQAEQYRAELKDFTGYPRDSVTVT